MKVVVILSGGVDSSTVAYYARSKAYDVHAITFDYGQIASKEVHHAMMIADRLGINHKVINMSSLRSLLENNALMNDSIPMPSEFSPSIIVPFRNAIFLSIAVAYAVSIRASKVMYGAHGSDSSYYPDCRKEFYDAFQKAARLGTETQIEIDAPFHSMKKPEILILGSKLGVPYEITWSCYLNKNNHCGVCESCINRKKAFIEAELYDPTQYER
ncbi:7-cyano-7-deazaguanine synthase QueC [Candidatus Bathyarchaeota archaeon]|nr:7-cyano-7-deazaguanine synthase QueC [Candidatus Bathyarchaeota archaeon]MBS7628954.1 7-cyano-7-deazaguanine synthase QueC [Candidatus Bathyarchaeota archaeon]